MARNLLDVGITWTTPNMQGRLATGGECWSPKQTRIETRQTRLCTVQVAVKGVTCGRGEIRACATEPACRAKLAGVRSGCRLPLGRGLWSHEWFFPPLRPRAGRPKTPALAYLPHTNMPSKDLTRTWLPMSRLATVFVCLAAAMVSGALDGAEPGSTGAPVPPGAAEAELQPMSVPIQGGAASPLDEAKALPAEEVALFEKRIRPVLVQHCYECHGPETQRGGLRLDSRQGWAAGGDSGPAIVPGKPDDSLLLRAMRYDDPNLQMPPDGKLPEAVVADFNRWIERGAVDPRDGPHAADAANGATVWDAQAAREHWAYQPVARPALPAVAGRDWPINAIDVFILQKLQERGLEPAAEAPAVTLVRRVYFDLVGLPPPPEVFDEFLAGSTDDAYERLVHRLLASPRFGERWGRHWFDVVRYGESLTLRGFILQDAWRYRDYVIESFHLDRPYDRFVREQIAGDLLPANTIEQQQRQLVATTFLMLGNHNLEEQDKAQLEMDVIDEQLEAIGRGFLAQTIGCARCHDHKFDPIPTGDYYALAAIFRGVQSLEHANVSQWLALPLPLPPAEERTLRASEEALAELERQIEDRLAALARLNAAAAQSTPTIIAADALAGVVIDDAQAKRVGTWQFSQYSKRYIGAGYVHDQNTEKGAKTLTFHPEVLRAGQYEVRLAYTPGENRATNVPVTVFSADGEYTVTVNQQQEPAVDGHFVSLGRYRFEDNGQGFVLISNQGTDGHVIADAVQFLPVEHAAMPQASQAVDSPQVQAQQAELADLQQRLERLKRESPRRPTVLGVRELGTVPETRIHIRGSVHNLGEAVPRGFPAAIGPRTPREFPADRSGRRELAEWLTSPDHPLTARVYVNRVWHWLLGRGLVGTPDNFGTTGERPTHPELLDYLTAEFIDHGWSTKWLVRQIVCSATYRQGTQADASTLSADPENLLYSRARRKRLEGECLRDAMLSAAGTLEFEMYGPTIKPGTVSDYGYEHRSLRRSVYVPVLRNALPEIFELFDFADPSVPTGARSTSTVAPQALFMMNHPFVHEQARAAAERLLAEPIVDQQQRLRRAFLRVLGREPRLGEVAACLGWLHSAAEDGSSPLDAWTDVVHALFGSLDFRYID